MSLIAELESLRVQKKKEFAQHIHNNFKAQPRLSPDTMNEQYSNVIVQLKLHCNDNQVKLKLTQRRDESITLIDMLIADGITNFCPTSGEILFTNWGDQYYNVIVVYPFNENPYNL